MCLFFPNQCFGKISHKFGKDISRFIQKRWNCKIIITCATCSITVGLALCGLSFKSLGTPYVSRLFFGIAFRLAHGGGSRGGMIGLVHRPDATALQTPKGCNTSMPPLWGSFLSLCWSMFQSFHPFGVHDALHRTSVTWPTK